MWACSIVALVRVRRHIILGSMLAGATPGLRDIVACSVAGRGGLIEEQDACLPCRFGLVPQILRFSDYVFPRGGKTTC